MLNYLFLAISSALAVTLCAVNAFVSWWWLLPLAIGAYLGVVVLYFLILFVISICMPKSAAVKKTSDACRFAIWVTMDWLMQMMRVKITLRGSELFPKEPCIVICNHRSDFDPMTVLAVMRKRKIAYISKAANFKIPIVGSFIHRAGFLAIDRGNGLRAMRTLKEAAELQKREGLDIGVYPEGTRSKNGELLRFKQGAYILAKDTQAPIVVMSTRGTEQISKRTPFRKTTVDIHVIAVIDRETVQALSNEELRDQTRTMIEQDLGENA